MSERSNDEFLNDCWLGLNPWEQQACQELEAEDDSANQVLMTETDIATKKLWASFQNAAQCVALMYKGSTDQQYSLWVPFQTAAGNVTTLYKDSVECLRKCSEKGSQAGYQKRNREIMNWARRKRHIRREELLAVLAGKPIPPKSGHFRGSPRTRLSLERMNSRLPSSLSPQHGHDDNLSTFREALGVHGSSPISPAAFSSRRRSSAAAVAAAAAELQSFVGDEFARHKRPAPSPPRNSSPNHDVTMDSPQHKRFKFT